MDQLETQPWPWQSASGSNTLGELAHHFFLGFVWLKHMFELRRAWASLSPRLCCIAVSKVKFPHLDAGRISQKMLPQRASRQEVSNETWFYPQATLFVVSKCKDRNRNANVYLQYCSTVYFVP